MARIICGPSDENGAALCSDSVVPGPGVRIPESPKFVLAGWLMPSGRFQVDQPVGYTDWDRAVCALAVPLYRVVA